MKQRLASTVSAFVLSAVLVIGAIPGAVFATPGRYSSVWINGESYPTDTTKTDNAGEGSITWDPEVATLTLDNATLTDFTSINMTDPSDELRVILIGDSQITAVSNGIHSNANLIIQSQGEASLTASSQTGNAIYGEMDITIAGGTYNLSASGNYPTIYSSKSLVIENGAKLEQVNSSQGYGIQTSGEFIATGDGTYINVSAKSVAVFSEKGMEITEGASLSGYSSSHYQVYVYDDIVFDRAKVTLDSDYSSAIGVYSREGAINILNSSDIEIVLDGEKANGLFATTNISVADSKLNVATNSTSMFASQDISILNSELQINSNANPINAKGKLTIDGAATNLISNGAYPISGNTIEIKDGFIEAKSTKGTTISAPNGIIVSGGHVSATTEAAMSAIYSEKGDITLDGADTIVEAISMQDSAIFTRNGSITLNASNITAQSAEGFSPIVARKSNVADTTTPPANLINIGENFFSEGNIVATTVWKDNGAGKFYADTMLVSEDTQLNADGLLPAEYIPNNSEITLGYKPADYTAVDAAIAKANELNPNLYQDFSAVEAAIESVDYGKNITEQTEVDAMAAAIEEAISQLELLPEPTIIEGANAQWLKGENSSDLRFVSDAPFRNFLLVTVDDNELSEEFYSLAEGSTIVTLKADYLKTLEPGDHTLAIVSLNGTARTAFTIAIAEDATELEPGRGENEEPTSAETAVVNPATGNTSNPVLWTVLVIASGLTLAGTTSYRRKQSK